MSARSQQETQSFKMSGDFEHLITYLPPLFAYDELGLEPKTLIEKLEHAINVASSFEQRAELQRLDDKRRFKPFLTLLKEAVQNELLRKFISQTLAFLPPDSKAVEEFYDEEDGLTKADRKETKAVTLTSNPIPPFKLDADLKAALIMSLQDAFDETEPPQQTATSAHHKLDPAVDITKLESTIARYSPEHQNALKQLNKAEEIMPFLLKLNSISEKDSFVAKITEMLLLSLQLATFPASPTTSSKKNAITLPPLSSSGSGDPYESDYEPVEHDLNETPLASLFPAYVDLGTPSQPTMTTPQHTTSTVGTNAAQQPSPSSSSTLPADNKLSDRYKNPGSAMRRISFTHTIGQPPVNNAAPSGSGNKKKGEDLEKMFPPLPTNQTGSPNF